jgi:ubiquinone/menaquinone biosynthesis C-methylase UbiE
MRVLRILLVILGVVAAFMGFYIISWFRERYGRGGPFPAARAAVLDHPLRRWIHPRQETLEKFCLKAGDTVLELGPGSGYFTAGASRIVGQSGTVLCVDIQPEMTALLQDRLASKGVTKAFPIVGDATRLPLSGDSVDAAFLVTVLGEIPDRPGTIAELRRVLKPGGVLSITENLTDPDYQFEASVRDLCRAGGFEEAGHDRGRLGYTMSFTAP